MADFWSVQWKSFHTTFYRNCHFF